jgi:hypothetical protein
MTTNQIARVLLTGVILELTLATALVHFSLGGELFILNGIGYLALGSGYAIAAAVPMRIVRRFGWLPRIGLAAYASVTIGAYLVIGPYFALGWITKAVEVAIVSLVLVDLLVAYGSPMSAVRAVVASLEPRRPQRGT